MSRRPTIVYGLAYTVVATSVAVAGTRRHDVPESSYINLASQPEFAAVGRVDINGNLWGTGVLISDRWVLTSATVAGAGDSTSGTFTVGGMAYGFAESVRHPSWNSGLIGRNGFDIGLIRLSTAVPSSGASSVVPAVRYLGAAELGATATIVGFGNGGTGFSGQIAGTEGVKRAGTNVLDVLGSAAGNSDNYLMTDFDRPNDTLLNAFGSSVPLPLEYCAASGDGGGGVYINDGGTQRLAGIVSFIQGYPLGTTAEADYWDLAGFTRVSQFNGWIDDQLPTRYWKTAASGSFGDGANWTEGVSPTAGNIAVFNQAGTYTVSLTNDVANKRLRVRQGEVTLDLAGHTHTLSDALLDPSIIVGQRPSDDAKLTISNGTVNAVDVSVGQVAGSKGVLTVNPGASLQIAGTLSVHGSRYPYPIDVTNIINLNGAPTTVGSFDLEYGTIAGSADLTALGASTWHSGTMIGSATSVKTVIAPGGTLNVPLTGDYVTLENRTLEIQSGAIINSSNSSAGTESTWKLNNAVINNLPGGIFNASTNQVSLRITPSVFHGVNAFNNGGTLNVSGENEFVITVPFNNTGTINVHSGSLFLAGGGSISGNINLDPGAILEISAVDSDSYTITNAALPQSGVRLIRGPVSIVGDNTFNDFLWAGGTLTGGAGNKTIIPAGGNLNTEASGTETLKLTARTLEIQSGGTISFSQLSNPFAEMRLNNGTINVLSGGTFNLAATSYSARIIIDGGTNALYSAGTLNKSGANTFGVFIPFNNTGSINVHAGTLEIDGHSFTQPSSMGKIILSSGTLRSSNPLIIQAGSLEGNGTVVANVHMGGVLSPGQSAGSITFIGNLSLQGTSSSVFEIGGNQPAIGYDQITVAGNLLLAGSLTLKMINSLPTSLMTDTFTIASVTGASSSITGAFANAANATRLLTADGIGSFLVHYGAGSVFNSKQIVLSNFQLSGDFDLNGAVDAADYVVWRKGLGTVYAENDYALWRTHFGNKLGSIITLSGDFNNNGVVDAADYVVWRKTGGSLENYNSMRAHFGESAYGGGATAASTSQNGIPEPANSLHLVFVVAVCLIHRRRIASSIHRDFVG